MSMVSYSSLSEPAMCVECGAHVEPGTGVQLVCEGEPPKPRGVELDRAAAARCLAVRGCHVVKIETEKPTA